MLARLKIVEKRKDRNVVETVYEVRNTKTKDGSAKINKFPYVRINVRTAEENVIMMKLSINHAIQNTPFVNPITFIVSFNRCSFSCTIDFTRIADPNIQDIVINIGKLPAILRINRSLM